MHGNNKSPGRARLRDRERRRPHRGRLVRRDRAPARPRASACCCASRPASSPARTRYIQTGQVDSKFGFQIDEVPRAVERVRRRRPRAARPARAHRLADPRRSTCSRSSASCSRGWATGRCSTSAAASASRTPREDSPPLDRGVRGRAAPPRARGGDRALRAGPLAGGQRRRDALHGRHRQADPGRAHLRGGGRRHVRQPAADALRRPLRGRDRGPLRRRRRCARSPACTASRATSSCATWS